MLLFTFLLFYTIAFHTVTTSSCKRFVSLSLDVSSVYSSEEDEEETEMYEHDYDGSLAKTGKRHLGKTRWTREEVETQTPAKTMQNIQMLNGNYLKKDNFPGAWELF